MIEYVHSVPGRIRIKAPLFRRDPLAAATAQDLLRELDGVTSATVNPTTGSLVVIYDPRR